jgi:predicted ABC-type transport system involved in lysophospholipase L1 biosynthesis ATPase subunit
LSDAPTLEAKAARIDLLGQPLLARLELTSDAERLALLGDWSALFRVLSGEAQLAAGALRIAGVDVPLGVVQGTVGLMRLESLLPGAWTSEQFLASSAELAGTPRATAPKLAFETLEQLGLVELASRRLAHLPAAERRAVLIAHAVLTNPRVLCLEDPLAGLDTHAENCVLAVIGHASADRRLLVAISDPGLSAGARQLVRSCTERLRLAAGVVLPELDDKPATSRVTATVSRNHQAFAAALSARGLTHHATHEAGMLNALTSNAAGPCWRYLVELPGGSSAPILDAALETEAGLVELIPVLPAS